MRKPNCDPPEWRVPQTKGESAIELNIRVITPMFGGGFEPGVVDTTNPIRAAAIRGHLRFWWRAVAGGAYETAQDLYSAESDIWGSAEKPGKVSLRSFILDKGDARKASELTPKLDPHLGPRSGIFTFPFREQKGDATPEKYGVVGVRFSLKLRFPEEAAKSIHAAIRAWLAFGGVGARTRRACGALRIENDLTQWAPPADRDGRSGWLSKLNTTPTLAPEGSFSFLAGAILVVGDEAIPGEAWNSLGLLWSRVRKGQVSDTEYSPMSGGKWRDYGALSQYASPHRQAEITLAKPFLGLPITYGKFSENQKGEEFSGTIEAGETSRMASPVILKPMFCADGNVYPLVLALTSPPQPTSVRIANGNAIPIKAPVISEDPVLKALGASDPLDAVVRAAERHLRRTLTRREILP